MKKRDRYQKKKQMEGNIYPGDINISPRQETLVTPQRMHPEMNEFRNIVESYKLKNLESLKESHLLIGLLETTSSCLIRVCLPERKKVTYVEIQKN